MTARSSSIGTLGSWQKRIASALRRTPSSGRAPPPTLGRSPDQAWDLDELHEHAADACQCRHRPRRCEGVVACLDLDVGERLQERGLARIRRADERDLCRAFAPHRDRVAMDDTLPRSRLLELTLDPLADVGVRAVPVARELAEDRAELANALCSLPADESALDDLHLRAMWHGHRVHLPFRPAGRCARPSRGSATARARRSVGEVTETIERKPGLREGLGRQVERSITIVRPREMKSVDPLGVSVVELTERRRIRLRGCDHCASVFNRPSGGGYTGEIARRSACITGARPRGGAEPPCARARRHSPRACRSLRSPGGTAGRSAAGSGSSPCRRHVQPSVAQRARRARRT